MQDVSGVRTRGVGAKSGGGTRCGLHRGYVELGALGGRGYRANV